MPLMGFGNYHQSEAIAGALPTKQNSPQQCPLGLYAEQLSGSAFTRPRAFNLSSWLYRRLPSVTLQSFTALPITPPAYSSCQPPLPMRWHPLPAPTTKKDLIDSLFLLASNGLASVYLYYCNQSMINRYFTSYDGELLFVPYKGEVLLFTEMGKLLLKPGSIAVIPRGIRFKMMLLGKESAGYLCENHATPLTLPNLGPIGANGLANPRHFLYPDAAFEDITDEITLVCKYQAHWWQAILHHSPLNVVAWHGNYAPYSYDLSLFNTINSVSFDHCDPSIFTVLTAESAYTGLAHLDFVIFPSRWVVAEHTFRPPYFHRNIMSEFMGLIEGHYDAKKDGFHIGSSSIHNSMTAHGPDVKSYESAQKKILKPEYYKNTLAFMFETRKPWQVTANAWDHPSRQKDYAKCWQGFSPSTL